MTAGSAYDDGLTRAGADALFLTPAEGNTAYVPKAGSVVVIGADSMSAGGGGPNKANNGRVSDWRMDAVADESVLAIAALPSWWATFHVDMVWANAGAGAGDVRFIQFMFAWSDGDNTVGVPTQGGGGVVATALAQNVAETTRMLSDMANDKTFMSFEMYRNGAHAADTLPNDAAFMALVLTRAT